MKPSTLTAYVVYIQIIHEQEKIVKLDFPIQKKNIKNIIKTIKIVKMLHFNQFSMETDYSPQTLTL